MEPIERQLARRRGQRKLDAMKRRAGQLRRRIVVSALVGFALLWAVVFVQMATGNDPVLGRKTATRSAVKKRASSEPARQNLQAAVPPPSEEESEGPTVEESQTGEASGVEAEQFQAEQAEIERAEAERLEVEQREAEVRELEELEAVSTGQS
jgi:hypothetical protein